jgi:hypothetical protein
MIKFFRKIRQRLLSEGKTGKYFKYAIGEIILVVIGILIALQINNWNEERKLSNNELNLLISLQTDLKFNLDEIIGLKNDSKSKIKSANIFLDNLNYNKISEDSIKSLVDDISGNLIFNNAVTTYRSISSNSDVTISNLEIREQVIKIYEQDFENIHIREEFENQILRDYYTPLILKLFKSSKSTQNNRYAKTTYNINIPIDLEDLSNNNEFINAVVLLTGQREVRELRLQNTIIELRKVIQTIDSDINEKLK